MIAEFVASLEKAGLTLTGDELTPTSNDPNGMTGREIAEALYLALYVTHPVSLEGGAQEPVPGERLDNPNQLPESNFAPERNAPKSESVATPTTPTGELFTRASGQRGETGVSARPFRAAAAIALPGAADIARALRPLLRRFPSRTRRQLDVERTIQQIADGGPFAAVERPARERWLDIALVVDEGASMNVWRPTVGELQRLLERHGAFRDVTVWGLNTDEGEVRFYRETGLTALPARFGNPHELFDPMGRRLIVLVSDCIGAGWHSGKAFQLLAKWGARNPVVLVQVLPQHLWTGTALPAADVMLHASGAGRANGRLNVQRGWQDEPHAVAGVPLPVVTLEDWSLAPWAQMVAARGPARTAGILITDILQHPPPASAEAGDAEPMVDAAALTAEQRAKQIVSRFRASATPTALRLACYLAAVELNLPVMRLVQQAMMPQSRQIHLAEVFLGGLLYQPDADESAKPDEIRYDFHPGVRERLLELVPRSETQRVVVEVWKLIEQRLPFANDFKVLLTAPELEPAELKVALGKRAFATISPEALKKMGITAAPPISQPEPNDSEANELDETVHSDESISWPMHDDEKLEMAEEFVASAAVMNDATLGNAFQTLQRLTLKQLLLIIQCQSRIGELSPDEDQWQELNQQLISLTETRRQLGNALQTLGAHLHERKLTPAATVDALLMQTLMTDTERLGQWRENAFRLLGQWLAADEANQVPAITESLIQLGELFGALGDQYTALRYFAFAHQAALSASLLAPQLEFALALGTAQAYSALGEFDRAERELAIATEIARAANDLPKRLQAMMARGAVQMSRGLLAESYAEYLAASEIAQQIGDQRSFAICLLQLGILSLKQGEPNRAIASLQEAAALFSRLESVKSEAQALAHLSRAYLAVADPQQAIELGDRAIHLFLSYQDQESVAALEAELARARQSASSLLAQTFFSFETVTLDERGTVKERRRLQARQLIEELAADVTLEMVEIPGGSFAMGSQEDTSEQPIRTVNVPPFFMGKFTITQAQWRVVAGWPMVERELEPAPSHFPHNQKRQPADDQRPVENVSWEEAQEFCARLSAKTGRYYRLPSEAEWEYACRAGTTTPFAFGPTITPEFVNYNGNRPYGQAPKGEYRAETIPVGSLDVANAFGLYDMHGNVWEWCEDVWYESYEDAPADGSAWLSEGYLNYRALRGGSWDDIGWNCRSANLLRNKTGDIGNDVGLRVVVSARTP